MKKILLLIMSLFFAVSCSGGSESEPSAAKDVCLPSSPSCKDNNNTQNEFSQSEKQNVSAAENSASDSAQISEAGQKSDTLDNNKNIAEINSPASASAKKKKIIFVIADGGGPSLLNLIVEYARYVPDSPYKGKPSNLEFMMNSGRIAFVINGTLKTLVTDSAAAATQLATGRLTNPGNLGVDENFNKAENLAETAKKMGLATGVVTNTHITDATPAAFSAHANNRNMHEFIARSYLEADHDVVLGGGGKYFLDDISFTRHTDLKKIIPYYKRFENEGGKQNLIDSLWERDYKVVFDRTGLDHFTGKKLFGLFAYHGMAYEISRPAYEPSLTEMASKALEVLSKNDKGFFLMIESGLLDWVAHPNEAGAVMKELLEMDRMLGVIKEYIDKNPETLLVITADHDTGGMGFEYAHISAEDHERKQKSGYELFSKTDGYSNGQYVAGVTDHMDYAAKNNLAILASQKKTYNQMYQEIKEINPLDPKKRSPEKISKIFYSGTGIKLPAEKFFPSMGIEDLSKVLNSELGMFWGTHNHTGAPLITVYYGNQQSLRGGVLQNTELHDSIEDFLKAK